MKSPEQYFLEQEQWSPEEGIEEFSGPEKAFLKKYIDIDSGLQMLTVLEEEVKHAEEQIVVGTDIFQGETELALDERTIADDLQERQEIQLVSFKVSEQEFVLPIDCVQEVVTYVEPTKLPSASRFIAGIANLRGRVTPLIRLDRLLGKENADMNFKFIVVCRFNELQVGLIIHSIATMYRVGQDQIDWGISNNGDDLVCGVIKLKDQLIGIVAIDRVIKRIVD